MLPLARVDRFRLDSGARMTPRCSDPRKFPVIDVGVFTFHGQVYSLIPAFHLRCLPSSCDTKPATRSRMFRREWKGDRIPNSPSLHISRPAPLSTQQSRNR